MYVQNFQLNFNFHTIMWTLMSLVDKLESQGLELLPRMVEWAFRFGSSKLKV